MSKSIKQALTTEEVRQVASRWLEAYDDGWRPSIYVESLEDDLARIVREALAAERKR